MKLPALIIASLATFGLTTSAPLSQAEKPATTVPETYACPLFPRCSAPLPHAAPVPLIPAEARNEDTFITVRQA